ncbi:MAG: YqgE/AlgH family protein [Myxococcota bacterium]
MDSLAPGFLIASPPLGDPNFDRTVVLLALHNEDGALGFVVNRESNLNLGELLDQAGYEGGHEDASPVWVGGPVQPRSGWVLSGDRRFHVDDDAIELGRDLQVSSSRTAFDRVAEAASSSDFTADRLLVMLGYSGWAPQQLEQEISRGAWLPVPLDAELLFDVAPEHRWERAYALLGLNPTQVMSMRIGGDA